MEEVKPVTEIKSTRCNQKTEVYSRVVGYFRPVQQWNKGKQEEFKDRVTFKTGSTVKINKKEKFHGVAEVGQGEAQVSDEAGEVSSPPPEGDAPK